MVEWSGPAKRDLKQIYDYIAQDSKYYAKNVVQNIVEKSKKLEPFPKAGRIVPEINDSTIREIFVYSYRLIYEVKSNRVEILAIIHGGRDFSSGSLNNLRSES